MSPRRLAGLADAEKSPSLFEGVGLRRQATRPPAVRRLTGTETPRPYGLLRGDAPSPVRPDARPIVAVSDAVAVYVLDVRPERPTLTERRRRRRAAPRPRFVGDAGLCWGVPNCSSYGGRPATKTEAPQDNEGLGRPVPRPRPLPPAKGAASRPETTTVGVPPFLLTVLYRVLPFLVPTPSYKAPKPTGVPLTAHPVGRRPVFGADIRPNVAKLSRKAVAEKG